MKESYTSKRRVRRNFGRIDAVADMPSLIEVQTGSYNSFIQANGAEKCEFGLEEVFKSIFPIRDFAGNGVLEFVKYELETPKYDVDECIKRDMTFAAPVKATLRLVVWDTDEATGAKSIHDIKEQDLSLVEGRNYLVAPNLSDDDIQRLVWKWQGNIMEIIAGWMFMNNLHPYTADFVFDFTGTPATKTVIEQHTDLTADFVEDYCHTIWYEEILDQLTSYNDENKGKFDIVAALGMVFLADQELSGRQPTKVIKEVEQFQDFGYYVDERGYKKFGVIPKKQQYTLNLNIKKTYDPYRIETSDPRLR